MDHPPLNLCFLIFGAKAPLEVIRAFTDKYGKDGTAPFPDTYKYLCEEPLRVYNEAVKPFWDVYTKERSRITRECLDGRPYDAPNNIEARAQISAREKPYWDEYCRCAAPHSKPLYDHCFNTWMTLDPSLDRRVAP